jgi:MFS family permease
MARPLRRPPAQTPRSAQEGIASILLARGLRAFGDGFVAILLPVHLARLGYGAAEIGLIATCTLLGSALLTLALGFTAHRLHLRRGLLVAGLLMTGTGLGFAYLQAFWPLLAVAFFGTLNPSGGDVSVFLPLEHALIANLASDQTRTAVYARYSFIGSIGAAVGSLAVGTLDWLDRVLAAGSGIRVLFLLYGAIGLATLLLYARLRDMRAAGPQSATGLGSSRGRVYALAALFSLDAFGGGFIVNSLLALWLFERFGLSIAMAGVIFFATGLCSSLSYFVAVRLATRFGLVNTMVFTHLPSSVFLILAALAPTLPAAVALLVFRSLLSQMDVPTRSSYVMAVVRPAERPAAASLTSVPRSLAAAFSPVIAGWALAVSSFGWPLVCAGVLKIIYDLALLQQFRTVRPPEEAEPQRNAGSPR